jgi:hypothetical protein
VLVGVAQAAGPDLDQDLAGPGPVDVDRLDREVLTRAVQQRRS